jgi:sterol desaturase/sphingolipid hydroxylase (fatty acid hydroxylase superfamily)
MTQLANLVHSRLDGDMNALIPSDHARVLFLLAVFGLVFVFEVAFPLYRYGRGHVANLLTNIAITVIFLGVNLAVAPLSSHSVRFAAEARFGLSYWLALPLLGQLLVGVIGLDLFAYLAHVTLHEFRWLWRFHRMHHSDNKVDVTTAFREHPGETLWRIGWHIAGVFAFGTPLSVLVTYLTLSAFNAQLEHANVRLPARLDRWLRVLYVTPNMHKVHHSRRQPETDMNYSNLLSLWDRLGGTYDRGPRFDELQYGLDGFDDNEKQSLAGLLKMPFVSKWGKEALPAAPARRVA